MYRRAAVSREQQQVVVTTHTRPQLLLQTAAVSLVVAEKLPLPAVR
jgi:hypothetical protein